MSAKTKQLTLRLSRERVAEFCADCAQKMSVAKIAEIKIPLEITTDDKGVETYAFAADAEPILAQFAKGGFSEGLCKKFGADEGFFTRCAASMSGKVDDEKAFCASLHKFCTGHWPGEKKMDEDKQVLEYANNIRGVEIFATGKHNGDDYTEKDLDDMVDAFGKLDYKPALKLGHIKDKTGEQPAYGWVEGLKRVGNKLVADFVDVHDKVAEAIRKRMFDRVSSEIYFNLKRGEKTFRRALKAVALLGSEVPAVAGLKPLSEMEFETGSFEAVKEFEATLDIPVQALLVSTVERMTQLIEAMKGKGETKENAMTKEELQAMEDLKSQVIKLEAQIKAFGADETTKRELTATKERLAALEAGRREDNVRQKVSALKVPAFKAGIEALFSYALAHDAEKIKVHSKDKDGKDIAAEKTLVEIVEGFVESINAQAEKLFKALTSAGKIVREDGEQDEDPSKEVDKRAKKYMHDHPEVKSYEQATMAVLSADTELKQKYRAQFERSN